MACCVNASLHFALVYTSCLSLRLLGLALGIEFPAYYAFACAHSQISGLFWLADVNRDSLYLPAGALSQSCMLVLQMMRMPAASTTYQTRMIVAVPCTLDTCARAAFLQHYSK